VEPRVGVGQASGALGHSDSSKGNV
jgi:hypothetical protein